MATMTNISEVSQRVVFLLDVDNTLLDNDQVTADLKRYLTRELGVDRREQYWAIFEGLRSELGDADYLGALQRYRIAHPRDSRVLCLSFLVNYPCANRLFPGSLDVIGHLAQWGPTVILTDGDVVVFQPLKIERSGLFAAVEGRVLVYMHKEQELEDVERRYTSDHYVFVDDKVRILTAIKRVWGARVTTAFPRQGHYAHTPQVGTYPAPNVTIERISDLLGYNLPALLQAARMKGAL